MATVTSLGSSFDTNSGTHTVTATPVLNDLVIIIVAQTGNTTIPAPTDNNSDGLGAYTALRGASRSGVDDVSIFARTSLVGSATSTVFSCAPGTTTGGGLVVLKVTGMSKTGVAALRSSGNVITGAAGGTPNTSMGQAVLTTNPVVGAVFNSTSPATMTPKASPAYSEAVDIGYSTPTTGLEVMYINSGETASSIQWGSTSATIFSAVTVELDASANTVTNTTDFFAMF